MNTREHTRKLVICALFSAIILALGLPTSPLSVLGYIRIQPFEATLLHIPVIVGAILEGPVIGFVLGTVFGITSMVGAIIEPASITAPAFMNPLVSVLPRMLVGLAAAWVYRLLSRRFKGIWTAGVTAVVATVVNTAGVFGMLFLVARFVPEILGVAQSIAPLLLIVVGTNAVPEAIVAAVITVPIVRALKPKAKR